MLQHRQNDGDEGLCAECRSALAVGPCVACHAMICADCGVFSKDPTGTRVICASCANLVADVRERRSRPRKSLGFKAIAVVLILAFVVVGLTIVLGGCGGSGASDVVTEPAPGVDTPAPPRLLRVEIPPGESPARTAGVVAARVFAFADSQLHYLYGKRTFAQSPFAERMSFEVAVRPAALDDGSDLLLRAFIDERAAHYRDHSLVFLGDASDLSCQQELDAFGVQLSAAGIDTLMSVTSNHDGFYAGNFTSKKDLDGTLALTDMPTDWTRACSAPGSYDDHRLTKGRAVASLAPMLPAAPPWATSVASDAVGPTEYRDAHMYYVRPLGGGDDGAPPVWGVFVDTVDYRGFALEKAQGAGTVGSISHDQIAFLDRAMFEARMEVGAAEVSFVVFGHHPYRELDSKSAARFRRFFQTHPEAIGYVSAHTHVSGERTMELDDGRVVPEIVIGSTTDAPQAARALEVHIGAGGERHLASRRLVLDATELCAGVEPMAPDTTGYTGYRILRDGTPELSVGLLDKLKFVTGYDDLGAKRTVQVLGALLMENELVRAWARLYADAPIEIDGAARADLDMILGARYAAGDEIASLREYLEGRAAVAITDYNAWHDPAVADIAGVAELGVHRFGDHAATFGALRAARDTDARSRQYFLCHAIYAARAEAEQPRREGNVIYIR